MDLAWRGIDGMVAERRPPNDPPNLKCGQIGARSMEIFRRLGLADKLRGIGLPADYPNDIVSATSVTGIELSRVPIPARGARGTPAAAGPDTVWPTPEHTHRCNQQFFEPVLSAHAAEQPRIRILHHTEITDLSQGEQGVTASAVDLDAGTRFVGCDGASSLVRKSIGSEFVGNPVLQYAQSFHVRAPQLRSLLPGKPAWLYFSLNPRRCGVSMAVDGLETWNIQNYTYPGENGLDHLDRDWVIRSILGVGPDFEYEVLSCENWTARRLVASRFRDRRVFICGDAAHVWMPLGGFGMSAGIANAANLAWKLAGVLHGWATPEILDAYESRAPADHRSGLAHHLRNRIPEDDAAQRVVAEIERPDAVREDSARLGRTTRLRTRLGAAMLRRPQFRLLLRSIADNRLRRGPGTHLHDGHVHLEHGARVSSASRLARRAPLAIRHDGAGSYAAEARPDPTGHIGRPWRRPRGAAFRLLFST
jgi:2-polyprenyl-6-methoxyphenol hydroxylase-like FAD-dependent oxidoreductase